MKKLLVILALFAASVHAATLVPIQLLNPAGSTSGQTILSTGASTSPAWGSVSATSLTGTLPVANGGTGVTSSTGTGAAVLSTGAAINPTSTGATTPGSGAFTSLASTNAKVFASNTSGQSLASGTAAVITGWTATTNVGSAFVASTGVFTAPVTGNYLVTGQLYLGVPMTLSSIFRATIIVNSVTLGIFDHVSQNATPSNHAVVFSAMVPATAGQQIVIDGFQNTGAAAALATGAALNVLSIMLVP